MSEDKARLQAFYLLDDIIQNKKYANLTLKNSLKEFESRDKAFICALVYGVLDKLINLDYIIFQYAKGKVNAKVKTILRMGVYQLLYMDKVPDNAAVSTSVDIAQKIGKGMLKGYINGVLRNISRNKNIEYPKDKIEYLSVKYSYPAFFVKELVDDIGFNDTEAFLSFEEEHKTCIRVDKNKADVNKIKAELSGEDSLFFDDCFYISGEPKYLESGICSVQSEASMVAVKALSVQKGDTVLDCCAAPGGKTVYIASLIKEGSVLAFDKHSHRVDLIKNNALRCGYDKIIKAQVYDMLNLYDGLFDKVLVDAPCSGMGVTGQKPEIKNTVTPEGFVELEKIQRQILLNASKCVKKGGTLVYSTCTVRKNENIAVVNEFLKNNSDFELSSMEGLFSEKFEEGRDMKKGYLQLYPHKDNTDGFFIARMKKI